MIVLLSVRERLPDTAMCAFELLEDGIGVSSEVLQDHNFEFGVCELWKRPAGESDDARYVRTCKALDENFVPYEAGAACKDHFHAPVC